MNHGKSFSHRHQLKKHIHTVHEGHKDYKCEFCGKSFFRHDYLKRHVYRTHEGHKDYKCESCGKSFTSAPYLKKHIHTQCVIIAWWSTFLCNKLSYDNLQE